MRKPRWARLWRVDEVIECLPIACELKQQVETELLDADPDAYKPDARHLYAHECDGYGPEPLEGGPRSLGRIWSKLSEPVQRAIVDAYDREYDR